MDFKKYLNKAKAQKQINHLSKKLNGKKVLIYGAGQYCRYIFENYDLSKLNIIAVADRAFEDEGERDFYGLNCIAPNELKDFSYDVILLGVYDSKQIIKYLKNELLIDRKNFKVKIRQLIKSPICDLINEVQRLKNILTQVLSQITTKSLKIVKSIQNKSKPTLDLFKLFKYRFIQLNNKTIKKKDILLISPPYWDMYSCFSALPCLITALKNKKFSASMLDLGIMTFHTDFDNNWYKKSKLFLTESFYKINVEIYQYKTIDSYEKYLEEMSFLNDKEQTLKDFQEIYSSLSLIQQGVLNSIYNAVIFECVVSPNPNTNINLKKEINTYGFSSLVETILKFDLVSTFSNLSSVIGISITSHQQLIPACALIHIIKIFKPKAKIIIGGSYIEVLKKSNLKALTDLLKKYCNFIIIGEGETAITMLMEHIKHKKHNLKDIPNIIYLKRNKIVINEEIIEDIDSLDAPDYEGVDFSLYLAQEPMLSYQASRGCHWGNCAFCNHEEKYRRCYRAKSVQKVIADLNYLIERYNIYNFQFVDEAIEPKYFIDLINALSKEEISTKIKWVYYSRVSHLYTEDILKKAKECGCTMVMFGVETFSQRLLNFVKKGTAVKNILHNLELFHNAGIKTHAWLISMLPTETKEELLTDIKILKENISNIDVVSMSKFYLDPNCDMYRNQEKFNITHSNVIDGFDYISQSMTGEDIDSSELDKIVQEEYYPTIKKYVFTGNRYVNFFKALKK